MRRFIVSSLLIIIFLMPAGCAPSLFSHKPVTVDQQRKKPVDDTVPNDSAKATVDEKIDVLSYDRKYPVRPRPPVRQPLNAAKLKTTEGQVSINVSRMQLPEFVIYVLGETMKIPFVMDQAMMEDKRVVTFSTPQPLPADKALEMVVGVLQKYDLDVEEKAGALHVMLKPPNPRPTFDIRSGRETEGNSRGDILQIIPLKFLHVPEIQPLINEVSRGVKIKPYARENVLILHGSSANIKQLMDFIDYFDVPSLQNKKIVFLRLTYWQPEEFISQLTKMLESMGINVAKTPKDPGPIFVAVRQMNAVLAVAPDEKTMKYIHDWKNRLDTVEAAGSDEKAYTFAPQFSRASDIVDSLLRLYGITPRSSATAGGDASGHATGTSSSSGYQTTGQGFQIPATDTRTTNNFGGSSAAIVSGKTASPDASFSAAALPNLKIAADNNKNIVIMICSPTVYRQHLELLRQLDTQTKQVLIEATIAELTLTDELKYGVEWYINNTIDGGPITGGTLGRLGLGTLGMTFSYVTATANFKAMLNALAKKDKANILSTPRLTVLDNHDALIQIGQDVPVATGEQTTASSTGTNPTIQRTIQYRSMGIILKVKPTINTEGLLTLELTQEVSDLSATTGISDSPIFLVRRINTSVVAAHGQTVALGGLMKDRKGVVERKVPWLGDIPLIGNLFKVTERTTERTELLILVTPTILTKTDDATKITDELKKEIKWMKF